jgi:tetratricopeptide (TPR) repeat protein
MNKFLFSLAFSLFALMGFSQEFKLDLPQDPKLSDEAKRKFALSVDDMSIKRYRQAANSLHWLMINAPKLYDGLYVNAYKAYEELSEAEADATKKQVYLDSMFIAYRLKDQIFELSDLEINNLAYRYYKYYKKDADKYDEALKVYARAYEKPSEVINNNLVGYMDLVRRSFIENKNLSEEQILDIYGKINSIIDQKIADGEDADRLGRYKEVVNQMLTTTVNVDCEFIGAKLYPALKQNPKDINLAKKIFQLSLSAKCSDEEFFLYAVEIVHKSEPTAGLAGVLAKRKLSNKEYDQSEKYFIEAISLEKDAAKKGELYLSLARMYAVSDKKARSKEQAMKAASTDQALSKDAYSLVGNLYMGSYDDCKQNANQVEDRAIFFAAYDMFVKASDVDGQKRAKAQFPTVAQVFEQNMEEGGSMKVGCLINVTTTIRTRPSE